MSPVTSSLMLRLTCPSLLSRLRDMRGRDHPNLAGVTWSTSKLPVSSQAEASIASRGRETIRVVLWHYVPIEYILRTSVQLEA